MYLNIIHTFILLVLISQLVSARQPSILQLKFEENYIPAYAEIIEMYKRLDTCYENTVLFEQGLTDCGKPLNLFIINNKKEFDPAKIKATGKTVLLINNGIHPGEPAGIDGLYLQQFGVV